MPSQDEDKEHILSKVSVDIYSAIEGERYVYEYDVAAGKEVAKTGQDRLIEHLYQANSNLQEALGHEQSARAEDRFLCFVALIILFDILVLGSLSNNTVPIVVLVLEILVLAVLSRRMGIKRTAAIVDRLMTAITGEIKVDK